MNIHEQWTCWPRLFLPQATSGIPIDSTPRDTSKRQGSRCAGCAVVVTGFKGSELRKVTEMQIGK